MKSQKYTNTEDTTGNALALVPKGAMATKARNKILSGFIGLISKIFSPSDLNYDSWSRLESHKYCQFHAQDSYQLRFYV